MASSGVPGAGTVALGGAATADADAAMVASAEPAAAAAAAAAATTTVADAAGGANAAPGAAKEASGSAKVAPDGSSGADATVEVAPGPGGAAAKPPSVSFFQLFRFCDRLDVALYVVGVIASIIQGCIFPIFTFLFAGLLNAFFDTGSLVATVNQYALYMLYIAIVVLISSALGLGCIAWASERQGARIRKEYLRALMRAEVGYHDTAHTSEATTRMTEDIGLVVRGVGEPLANAIQFGTQFVAGIALGYARGPALAAVVTAFLPLLALFAAGMKVFLGRVQKLESDAYARAGEVANEAIGNIRVVASYCGEEAEVARYSGHLGRAERMGILKGIATGTSLGGVWLSILATYAVGLWYGGVLIANSRAADATCTYNPLATGCFNGGSVINVFFAIIIAAFAIAQAAPNISSFANAQAAAATIFAIIDRAPTIDNLSAGGLAPDAARVRGELEFENVTFYYPSRPDIPVLTNFSLRVPAGSSLALVGPSGCGKSSVVALIQRWYDPAAGRILLDGVDLRDYNVQWLRERMGLVLQDPVLFQGTVAENIALGLPGGGGAQPRGAAELAALQPRIEAAARAANAHDFIVGSLTSGYATYVGERGSQMSGGQRQRVSIARALIRDPRILLLDEATSALDTRSEAVVQAAIDRLLAAKGADVPGGAARTSLCIAHRLSTIRDVDRIVVMEAGAIAAAGTHAELIAQGGLYAVMCAQQRLSSPQAAAVDKPEVAAPSPSPAALTADVAPAATPATQPSPAESLAAFGDAVRTAATSTFTSAGAPGHAVTSIVPTSMAADVASATLAADAPLADAGADAGADAATAAGGKAAADGKPGKSAAELDDEADGKLPAVPFSRVWAYQRPEALHLAGAIFCAMLAGASMPCFSIIFSRVMTVYYNPDTAQMQSDTLIYMGYFFLIGVVAFIGQFGEWSLFAYAGEKLTRRLRVATYRATLRCEIAYFDHPRNTTGRITSRMAEQAALIKATTGERLVLGAQNIAALAAGCAIAFSASWQIALLVLAIFPLIAAVGMVQMKLLSGMTSTQQNAEAGNIVLEATTSVRTIYAYGLQAGTLVRFADALRPAEVLAARRSFTSGLAMGASFFVLFASYGLVFWAGGQFISQGWTTFQAMLQSFFAIIMAAQGAGQAAGLATDQAKADRAKRAVFALLDRVSAIDPLSEQGEKPATLSGAVEFRDVVFAYPTRPEHTVLRGLSLRVPAGATCALVGPSGGGKSTLVALLQRYYDVRGGAVLFDGHDVQTLPPHALRAAQSLVPQMPALFSDSIEYNVAYGALPGRVPTPDAGMAVDAGAGATVPPGFVHAPEVEAAACKANAHDFIASFTHGYATHCGAGGAGLSGGQRSRVAIARAVMRQPKVLLLDEATAALDSESERIVQAALDALIQTAGDAMTKFIVAHRLATIRRADMIAVINDGVVQELGTHAELIAKPGGLYRGLALAQDPDALNSSAAK